MPGIRIRFWSSNSSPTSSIGSSLFATGLIRPWSSPGTIRADGHDDVMSPIMNQSQTARDALTGAGLCGSNAAKVAGGYQARCGYGTRLPFLIVSPWANQNYVDHHVTDQTSIIRFIEDIGKPGGSETTPSMASPAIFNRCSISARRSRCPAHSQPQHRADRGLPGLNSD